MAKQTFALNIDPNESESDNKNRAEFNAKETLDQIVVRSNLVVCSLRVSRPTRPKPIRT